MKLAIEMFSIVIVVTIACIVFSSYISTENQNVKARDFYNVAVNRIEDSNCDAQVIKQCKEEGVPVISALGTGNKLDPSKFEITDVYKTSVCPLAKVMRKELRKRNIENLKVIYSKEEPIKPEETSESSCKTNCICPPGTKRKCSIRNQVPGSISFVPSVAGLMIAGEVVRDILKGEY